MENQSFSPNYQPKPEAKLPEKPKKVEPSTSRLLPKIILAFCAAALISTNCFAFFKYQEVAKENQDLKAKVSGTTTETSKSDQKQHPNTPSDSPESPASPDQTDPNFKPNQATIENIAAIFNTGDTRPFSGYLADRTTLYHYGTKPTAIFEDKKYAPLGLAPIFGSATVENKWNFNLTSSDLSKYQASPTFGKFFANGCLVGRHIAPNEAPQPLVSLCFNTSGKIHSIFIADDYSMGL